MLWLDYGPAAALIISRSDGCVALGHRYACAAVRSAGAYARRMSDGSTRVNKSRVDLLTRFASLDLEQDRDRHRRRNDCASGVGGTTIGVPADSRWRALAEGAVMGDMGGEAARWSRGLLSGCPPLPHENSQEE